jgi:hypothetical protein
MATIPHNIWPASVSNVAPYYGASANGFWRISPIVTRGARGAVRRTGWSAINIDANATKGPYTMNAKTLRDLGAKLARI